MENLYKKKVAPKTKKRLQIIEQIVEYLTDEQSLNSIGFKNEKERILKLALQPKLISAMTDIYKQQGYSLIDAKNGAHKSVQWEGTPDQTIPNEDFMGCSHRPDFKIVTEEFVIAVEVKIGDTGFHLREGLGQALVYSKIFDFTVYLFVDNSKSQSIKNAYNEAVKSKNISELKVRKCKELIDLLRENLNIWFIII